MDQKKQLTERLKLSESQIEAFTLKIEKLLGQGIRKALSGKDFGKLKPREAAQVISGMKAALSEMGLQNEVNKLTKIYAEELQFIARIIDETALDKPAQIFTTVDTLVIEELVKFDLSAISNRISVSVDTIQSQLMRNVITGTPIDLESQIVSDTASLQKNLYTEINTMMGGFSQSVTISKAKELGFELFVYLGPDDEITRDFCEHLLNKKPPIYKLSEIQQMNNGQGLPVITYGGGYNCRHQWRPVTEESAREQGYKS